MDELAEGGEASFSTDDGSCKAGGGKGIRQRSWFQKLIRMLDGDWVVVGTTANERIDELDEVSCTCWRKQDALLMILAAPLPFDNTGETNTVSSSASVTRTANQHFPRSRIQGTVSQIRSPCRQVFSTGRRSRSYLSRSRVQGTAA